MRQQIDIRAPGDEADIYIRPYFLTLSGEVTNYDGLTRTGLAKILLEDGTLSPEEINKFNSAWVARTEEIRTREATVDTLQERQAFFNAEGGQGAIIDSFYSNMGDEFQRFAQGDPTLDPPTNTSKRKVRLYSRHLSTMIRDCLHISGAQTPPE